MGIIWGLARSIFEGAATVLVIAITLHVAAFGILFLIGLFGIITHALGLN